MNVLVTGARGQLGREWMRYLQARGLNCSAYSSREMDITDSASVENGLNRDRPDLVINCAAWTDVDGAEDHYEEAKAVNCLGPALLAAECGNRDIKLVHYSTDYVFSGTGEDRNRYPDGYTETVPASPVNSYGRSKHEGEKLLLSDGAPVLVIRLSWLCGVEGSNFVNTMLRIGRKGEVSVVNDQFGSPTWADEIPEATLRLLYREQEGIFHYTSTGVLSWYELAQAIFKEADMKVSVTPIRSDEYPTRARRPYWSKLNTDKYSRITGVVPAGWRSGLKRLLRRLSDH